MKKTYTIDQECLNTAKAITGLINGMKRPAFILCGQNLEVFGINEAFRSCFDLAPELEFPQQIEFLKNFFDPPALYRFINGLKNNISNTVEIDLHNNPINTKKLLLKPLKYQNETDQLWIVFSEPLDPKIIKEPPLKSDAKKICDVIDIQEDIIFRFNTNLELLIVNQAYCNFVGKTKEEVLGKCFLNFAQPSEQDRIASYVEQLIREPKVTQYEYLEVFAEGDQIWWEWTDYPILDDEGKVVEIQTVGRNITEKKHVEEQNKTIESVNNLILNNVPDLIFFISDNGTYLDVRTKNADQLLLPKEKFIGRTISDVLPEEAAIQAMDALKKAIESNEVVSYSYSLEIEQELKYFENRIAPINEKLALAIIRDISESKKADQALKESEQRWKFALEGNGDGLWDWNIVSNKVYYSAQWRSILGYDKNEAVGIFENWQSLIHPDDISNVLKHLENALRCNDGFYRLEYRMRNHSGQFIWIRDRGKVMERDKSGKPTRMIGTIMDITESKLSQQALFDSEQRWKFALEGNGDGLWDWNPKTNQTFFSNQWKSMLGYEEDEIENKLENWEKLIHPEDTQRVLEELQRHIKGETEVYSSEHRLLCKDGSYK